MLLPGVSRFESNPYCQGLRRWKFHLTVVFAEGATGRDLGLGKVPRAELLQLDVDGFLRKGRETRRGPYAQAGFSSLTV